MTEEYEISYEIRILYSNMWGALKDVVTSGIEIVEAKSYMDAQDVIEKKLKSLVKSGGNNVSVIPAIKSIKKLN